MKLLLIPEDLADVGGNEIHTLTIKGVIVAPVSLPDQFDPALFVLNLSLSFTVQLSRVFLGKIPEVANLPRMRPTCSEHQKRVLHAGVAPAENRRRDAARGWIDAGRFGVETTNKTAGR